MPLIITARKIESDATRLVYYLQPQASQAHALTARNTAHLPLIIAAQADSFQIISQDGSLQNLVQLFGGFVEISANAQCEPAGDARTTVDISQAGRCWLSWCFVPALTYW